jgi:hypothetical protein
MASFRHALPVTGKDRNLVSSYSPTGVADPRGMKLCPIHRTSLFLSDGWVGMNLGTRTHFSTTYELISLEDTPSAAQYGLEDERELQPLRDAPHVVCLWVPALSLINPQAQLLSLTQRPTQT